MSDTISKSAVLSFLDNYSTYANYEEKLVIEYFRDAIESGRFDTEGWISVKDRLPEHEGDYLTVRSPYYRDIVSYENHKWIGVGLYGNLCEATNVTHWMPLPEPPKGEDNE